MTIYCSCQFTLQCHLDNMDQGPGGKPIVSKTISSQSNQSDDRVQREESRVVLVMIYPVEFYYNHSDCCKTDALVRELGKQLMETSQRKLDRVNGLVRDTSESSPLLLYQTYSTGQLTLQGRSPVKRYSDRIVWKSHYSFLHSLLLLGS